jgi:putative tricarboxylic transport membrane protein
LNLNRKILFEIGILLFSLFYFLSSTKLEMGELSRPGPGLFPLVLGAAGVVIASLLVAGSYLRKKREGKKEPPSLDQVQESKKGFLRIVGYVLTLTALVCFYEVLGSLVGFFLVTVMFGKISGMRGWRQPFLLGLCTSVSIYVIFGLWFKLPLPGGILENLF